MESKTSYHRVIALLVHKPEERVVKRHFTAALEYLGFEDQGSRPEMWVEQ